jgi:hypothetical protein
MDSLARAPSSIGTVATRVSNRLSYLVDATITARGAGEEVAKEERGAGRAAAAALLLLGPAAIIVDARMVLGLLYEWVRACE